MEQECAFTQARTHSSRQRRRLTPSAASFFVNLLQTNLRIRPFLSGWERAKLMGVELKLVNPGVNPYMPLSLTTPQERRVEASQLPSIIAAYIETTSRTVSPAALKNYARYTRLFMLWWESSVHHHENIISRHTLALYVQWLRHEYEAPIGGHASEYTTKQALVVLRRVLRWAHAVGAVGQDISELVPTFEAARNAKYYPSVAELARLFEACDGATRVRDMSLLAFLLATGARRHEAACATVENVHFNTPITCLDMTQNHGGYVHLRITKGDRLGRGLGRYSLFGSKPGLLLKVWLRWSGNKGDIYGLTDNGIRYIINDVARRAGIRQMHPHACRSAFVSWWAMENAEKGQMADNALRWQVGHALPRGDVQAYYLSDNPEWRRQLIAKFYTSPMRDIAIDWRTLPVHIPDGASPLR